MADTDAASPPAIHRIVGVFPGVAQLEDAATRLTLAGFDRAAISRPPVYLPPEEATSPLDGGPALTEADRRQARTLGTSMSGAVVGLAAAGVTVATGGAAAVAALAAVGAGGVAAFATAAVQRGAEETYHEESRMAADLGQLTLSVGVASEDERTAASAAMRAAGASEIVGHGEAPAGGAAA
jgi:hypothetical protein